MMRMIVLRTSAAGVAACIAALVVWFFGFDAWWSVTTVLVVGPVGAVIATRPFDDYAEWEPPPRETPRATRLAISMLEASLAACDRLARPPALRRLRALVVSERDDRLARTTVMRQMRALLGADAFATLQPHDDTPVSADVIARCLDDLERVATDTSPSR